MQAPSASTAQWNRVCLKLYNGLHESYGCETITDDCSCAARYIYCWRCHNRSVQVQHEVRAWIRAPCSAYMPEHGRCEGLHPVVNANYMLCMLS